jgi:pimeloyl-ACP methyl ester carboxylesterase
MVQQVTDNYLAAIAELTKRPAVIGHSFGGLISLKIAGGGASFATVSIDNAPFKGVLPLPVSALKSAAPVLGNPANHGRAISLTFEQFQFGWANNLEETEARRLYETYHVPASGAPLFQAAVANFNPFGGETKVNTENTDRGPVLIIAGDSDNTAPTAITHAAAKYLSKHSEAVTEVVDVPDRGHSLTIDHGWREVAEIALGFVKRFG